MTRRAMVWAAALVVIGGLAVGGGSPRRAAADPAPPAEVVALLPLDAERSLEIYGQPVASEIARALSAGHVPVVVIGPRSAVAQRARLIIDGTIALGKANTVTISLRIRDAVDGVVLDTLAATAPGLARIDGAAAELSVRVLPIVRDRLAALRRSVEDRGHAAETRPPPPPASERPVLVAFGDARATREPGPLPAALEAAVTGWLHAQRRPLEKIDAARLDRRVAVGTVAARSSDLAIGFWILGWTVEYAPDAGAIAMARARVRVQITDARSVVFDRVVVTDTVLGDRGLGQPELASRVAREVLAILRPHMRRTVPSWQ